MPASVRDVAEAAGVSVGTVSNVLNRPGRVSDATAERVHAAIERLGFVRNDAARQLRAGRSRSIGLVVLDVGNPFFADVARGVQRRADDAGLSVLVGNSDEDGDREQAYLDLFREQRVNGVLITPATADTSRLERVRDAGVQIVLVDHELPGSDFPSVSVDDVEGGRLAVGHLLAGGHRRIGFVSGPASLAQMANRLTGAREAVEAGDGATLEVIEMSALTVLNGRAAGEEILRRPVSERPEAVFAANDLLALGLLQALTMAADIRVPDDIAIIGYDDINFAASAVVPLSSIRQPAELLGRAAVELLDAVSGGDSAPPAIRFRPELVVRRSSGGL